MANLEPLQGAEQTDGGAGQGSGEAAGVQGSGGASPAGQSGAGDAGPGESGANKIEEPAAAAERRFSRRLIWVFAVLLAILAGCSVLLWTTRDAMGHLSFLHPKTGVPDLSGDSAAVKPMVDLRTWRTAEALAPLAVTAEEADDARQAQALADHESDQAFATALRRASLAKPKLTPEALELTGKVAALEATVKQDNATLDAVLTAEKVGGGRRAAAKSGTPQAGAGKAAAGAADDSGADVAPDAADSNDVAVAKAQLKLDRDELDDARRDLQRAAGNDRTRIQQELAAHEASMKAYDSRPHETVQTAVISAGQYGTLAGQIGSWWKLHTRRGLIEEARKEAAQKAGTLTDEHRAMGAKAAGAGSLRGGGPADGGQMGTRLAKMQELSSERQMMSIYDDRVATERQLAAVYAKWEAQVYLQRRIVLHLMLQSVVWIVLIVLCAVAVDWGIHSWMGRPPLDRRRSSTLRRLLTLMAWLVGFVLVMLVVFGAPQQTPTVIGLATAGLTVAMQDFIVAFLGWFVLMGKNGIRVGDAVEINSVAGEVVDIGLFRTTLLETGNWTDKGHPTGRRVSFLNGFAIRGQYFNFTTTGQWMWDTITVSVPASEDTYATIAGIHKAVLELTDADARRAEEEWKRSAKLYGLGQFSAQAAVDLRPAASGMDLKVRYVTRASERVSRRNELYQRMVDVLRDSQAAKIG